MDVVWNIYKVLVEEDREEHLAIFTDQDKANDAINRMRVRDMDDDEVDYNLRSCGVDPTPEMLELPPTLKELGNAGIVDAAYFELCNNGELMIPLWINPAWLVHEVRVRHDVGIDFAGRKMTLVSDAEVERRERLGMARNINRPDVVTEPDDGDAGFTETR